MSGSGPAFDAATMTLTGARDAMARGETTAETLLRTVFARHLAVEETVRAFVEVYPKESLNDAQVADRRRQVPRPGPPPALLGIPIAVKDIFDIAGKATRCNTRLRDDAEVAHRDSVAVHRLRKAGAVLIGKTVTQELAAGVISPPCRNPWDPTRIPGGSSGGSAASVISGTCLGALGSDTGGSIRIPASVTGTVGLKPTLGQIPTTGVYPLSASLDTVGPITRTVADALLLYLVLADRVPEIPEAEATLAGVAGEGLRGKRIGLPGGFFEERVQPGVATAFATAVATLSDLGAEIVPCEWPHAAAARAAALLISRVEAASVHRDALRATPDLIGEDVRLRLEIGAMTPGDVYVRARQTREAARRSIAALYHEHRLDAIATPTTPATALLADDPVATFPGGSRETSGPALTRFTMPWNATGQPAISLPCGFDADGLPVGLSLVGSPHRELELCGLAHAFERATNWHTHLPSSGT